VGWDVGEGVQITRGVVVNRDRQRPSWAREGAIRAQQRANADGDRRPPERATTEPLPRTGTRPCLPDASFPECAIHRPSPAADVLAQS
jgi:hypothetical protein